MTALDDMLAKADEVLVLDESVQELAEELSVGYSSSSEDSLEHFRVRQGVAAPDLARALKAVAEALEDVGDRNGMTATVVDDIRAAIERRLKEPK